MATPEDIENRLTAVEREVAQLRAQTGLAAVDASAARTLAAGADRDVSEVRAELRAHTGALNALRQSQLEMGQQLTSLDQRLTDGFATAQADVTGLEQRLTTVQADVTGLERRLTDGFANTQAGLAQVVRLLEERDG